MKISEKIKLLRIKNNETQQDLADKLNVSFQSVSKWENDLCLPTLDIILELAKHYNVAIDRLVIDDLDIIDNDKILDESSTTKTIRLTPTINKESMFAVYFDKDGVYDAYVAPNRHRTPAIEQSHASNSKNDIIIAVNEHNKIIYLCKSTGHGYGSPCDSYYHSSNVVQTSQMECFYLMRNYAPYGDRTNRYNNWEFVIPINGFVITISEGTLEYQTLFNALNKNKGVTREFSNGSLDDVIVTFENGQLVVSYQEKLVDVVNDNINNTLIEPIVKKYIDESNIINKVLAEVKSQIEINNCDYVYDYDFDLLKDELYELKDECCDEIRDFVSEMKSKFRNKYKD